MIVIIVAVMIMMLSISDGLYDQFRMISTIIRIVMMMIIRLMITVIISMKIIVTIILFHKEYNYVQVSSVRI